MIFKGFKINNSDGVHLRTAQAFSKAMRGFSSDITVRKNGGSANAKSVISLMSACIRRGDEITVICQGEDEAEMMSAAERIIENGFRCV